MSVPITRPEPVPRKDPAQEWTVRIWENQARSWSAGIDGPGWQGVHIVAPGITRLLELVCESLVWGEERARELARSADAENSTSEVAAADVERVLAEGGEVYDWKRDPQFVGDFRRPAAPERHIPTLAEHLSVSGYSPREQDFLGRVVHRWLTDHAQAGIGFDPSEVLAELEGK